LSYATIIGYLSALIWIVLSEISVRKLQFENQNKQLILTKKSFFGKEKNETVKYSNLEFEVENLNKFWGFLYGKKRLTLRNNNTEIAKLKSIEEFNIEEIEMIEKSLMEIKMPAGNSGLAPLHL
jgi:hypothetical protein